MDISTLRKNKHAVLELPMKLIIIATIMAIIIPAVFAGLNYYQERQIEMDTEMEIDRLVDKIQSVYNLGNTSTDTIEVSFHGGFMASFEYVKIGNNILPLNEDNKGDEFSKYVRYKIDGKSMKMKNVGNLVTNKTYDGPLILRGGDYKLRLVKNNIHGEHFVTVEII